MKKTLLACVGALFILSACNTISGAGQDVKAGGQDLSHAADKTKDSF